MAKPELLKKWDKCPHCGSAERVAETYMADKKLPPTVKKPEAWALSLEIVQMGNPEDYIGLALPTLVRFKDQCLNCGAEYFFRVDHVEALVTGRIVPPGTAEQIDNMRRFGFGKRN